MRISVLYFVIICFCSLLLSALILYNYLLVFAIMDENICFYFISCCKITNYFPNYVFNYIKSCQIGAILVLLQTQHYKRHD